MNIEDMRLIRNINVHTVINKENKAFDKQYKTHTFD